MTAVVDLDARLHRIDAGDLSRPVAAVDRMALPARFAPGNPAARRDLAASLRIRPSVALDGPPPPSPDRGPAGAQGAQGEAGLDLDGLREAIRRHPCHRCKDREHHARWAQPCGYHQLNRETESLRRRVDGRTHSVARTFERICRLLVDQGYMSEEGDQRLRVTPSGRMLQRLYLERDLLAAECLRQGIWQGLDAASLAAVVSCLIHEPRREGISAPRLPNDAVTRAHEQMVAIWSRIEDAETARGLPVTAAPEAGLAWMVHRWARGRRLDDVLWDSDLAAGDFVRRCKQVIDVLDQIADVAGSGHAGPAGEALAHTARAAVRAMLRGVVAADRID